MISPDIGSSFRSREAAVFPTKKKGVFDPSAIRIPLPRSDLPVLPARALLIVCLDTGNRSVDGDRRRQRRTGNPFAMMNDTPYPIGAKSEEISSSVKAIEPSPRPSNNASASACLRFCIS